MDKYICELLQKWCPEQPEEILEVGCGAGYWLEYLLKIRKTIVVGVDISPDMLAVAERRFSGDPRVRLYEGDIRNMDFLENDRFDFTFCAWIFQYLVRVNFREGLRELKRVTKPGGVIMLTENIPHGDAQAFTFPTYVQEGPKATMHGQNLHIERERY